MATHTYLVQGEAHTQLQRNWSSNPGTVWRYLKKKKKRERERGTKKRLATRGHGEAIYGHAVGNVEERDRGGHIARGKDVPYGGPVTFYSQRRKSEGGTNSSVHTKKALSGWSHKTVTGAEGRQTHTHILFR
jgi:hypothetical protein